MEMGHIAALFKDTIAGVTPLYGSIIWQHTDHRVPDAHTTGGND